MKIVHLIQYYLGGGRRKKGGKGGQTPTPQLPDAGRPHVYSCDIDPTTLKVVVKACVDRAGEVKDPDGELEYFDVEIPEKYTGIIYKYNVKNATGRTTLKFTAGSGDAPVVNGASVPLSIVLNAGQEGVVYSPVGKFELNTPLQNGELEAVHKNDNDFISRRMFFFADKVTLSRTTEGYLLVERSVISKD